MYHTLNSKFQYNTCYFSLFIFVVYVKYYGSISTINLEFLDSDEDVIMENPDPSLSPVTSKKKEKCESYAQKLLVRNIKSRSVLWEGS